MRILNRSARLVLATVAAASLAPCAVASAAGTPLVSLGDSYSSGEGAGPFDRGTDTVLDRCHRSANAWPRLLGVPMADHLACSGAATKNFRTGKTLGRPDNVGQLVRLRAIAAQGRIGRVVVTIGGNDLHFASILADCFVANCLTHLETRQLPHLRDMVQPAVTDALSGARTDSGGADVVLIGYPDLIAPAGRQLVNCRWLTADETPRLRRLQRALDDEQRRAAAAAGASYVSVRKALAGHELCTADSWIRAVGHGPLRQRGHPTADGQAAIARAVAARLKGRSRARNRSLARILGDRVPELLPHRLEVRPARLTAPLLGDHLPAPLADALDVRRRAERTGGRGAHGS